MAENQQPESGAQETVELKLDKDFCHRLNHEAHKRGVSFNELICTMAVDWLESGEKKQG